MRPEEDRARRDPQTPGELPRESEPQDPDYPAGAAELPRAGAPSEDPYTPEPGPRRGEQPAFRALRWAWIAVLIVVAVVVWAVLR
jgi:hypothetical protein